MANVIVKPIVEATAITYEIADVQGVRSMRCTISWLIAGKFAHGKAEALQESGPWTPLTMASDAWRQSESMRLLNALVDSYLTAAARAS